MIDTDLVAVRGEQRGTSEQANCGHPTRKTVVSHDDDDDEQSFTELLLGICRHHSKHVRHGCSPMSAASLAVRAVKCRALDKWGQLFK